MKKVTLKDIAELCKVSPTVVSAVLNRRHGRILCSETKKKEIFEAAKRLHYHPNLLARSMVAKSAPLIGVMLHLNPEDFKHGINRYFAILLPEITFALNKAGFEVLFVPYATEDEQTERLANLVGSGLLGGVVCNIIPDAYRKLERFLTESQLPHIILGYPIDSKLHCIRQILNIEDIAEDYRKKINASKLFVAINEHDNFNFYAVPLRYGTHYFSEPLALNEADFNSPDNLFVLMGGNLVPKISAAKINLKNRLIIDNISMESDLTPGVPAILISDVESKKQVVKFAADSIIGWIKDGQIPLSQNMFEFGKKFISKGVNL